MKVNELEIGKKVIVLIGKVIEKQKIMLIPGTTKKVVNIIVEDETGRCDVSVYGELADKIQVGNNIQINYSLCKGEYNGLKKITPGRYGRIIIK